MFRCTSCGEELINIGAFDLEEIYPEEKVGDEDGVVGIYACEKCELDYEITTYENQDHIKILMYDRED